MHVLVMGGEGQLGRTLRSVFGEQAGVTVTSWDLPEYDMTQTVDLRSDRRRGTGPGDQCRRLDRCGRGRGQSGNGLCCERTGTETSGRRLSDVRSAAGAVQYERSVLGRGRRDASTSMTHPTRAASIARSKAAGERAVQSTLAEHYHCSDRLALRPRRKPFPVQDYCGGGPPRFAEGRGRRVRQPDLYSRRGACRSAVGQRRNAMASITS